MITSVDSNVLIDVLAGQGLAMKEAAAALEIAQHAGEVLVSAVVYSELSARFLLQTQLDEALLDLDILVRPLDAAAAFEAGQAFAAYLKRGGTRQRILTDFLIGAHAASSASVFLTRDARFFQAQFAWLDAITPVDLIAQAGV